MAKLQELQKKPLIKVADTANSSEHLQTRPFAPVNSSNTQQSTPSIQTKTKRAGNFGHNFANLAVIQPKLTIGEPGDKYEQEADNVAAQVVEQINSPAVSTKNDKSVQRMETDEDELQMKPLESIQRQEIAEEEELQMKPVADVIQRVKTSEEEELQMKSAADSGRNASADLETSINQARGGGQSLNDSIRQPMEQAFGADFSGVKVHTDSKSDQLNQSIQAKAFTTGQDIFFRQGEYNPGNKGGQELLAHELTHVVQQTGTSSLTAQPKLMNGNTNNFSSLEVQAKPFTTQQAPANVIQREAVMMSVKGVMRGQTNLYSGTGQKVGTIKKGTRIVVDKDEDAMTVETKGGKGSKHKQIWQIIDVLDIDGITGGNLDDLWISHTRVTEKTLEYKEDMKSKLKEFADTIANYHAIHQKYNEYSDRLGSKGWNTFNKAWDLVNKILGWVSNFDPSGITKVISKVSQAVRKVAGYVAEAAHLMNPETLQEVTPFLQKGFSLPSLKEAYEEMKEFKGTITDAWDEVKEFAAS